MRDTDRFTLRLSKYIRNWCGAPGLGALLCTLILCAPAPRHTVPTRSINVIHYRFELVLNDTTDEIIGRSFIDLVSRQDLLREISLDLDSKEHAGDRAGMTVRAVTAKGKKLSFLHDHDQLKITLSQPLGMGDSLRLNVNYQGIPADGLIISKNHYQQRTFFGDNWPNRAHYWIPSVDHPSDKATSEFVVTAPDAYQVISNGRLIKQAELPGGLRITHWSSSVPLPTKVMVIGVAPFAVEREGTVAGVPLENWVYPRDREPGFADFSRADSVLIFMVDRVGPFPFEKLANVQSTTRYGGMENAGAIFYAEDAVDGTGANEDLIAHEIAHQWFGDAVTEADWYHVWLSEGFATYFAALYDEWRYGTPEFRKEMQQAREIVFAYERQTTHTAVVDTSIQDLNELLNPVTYQKGAWVLHMLRNEVGDTVFWQGIRSFYTQYRNKNVLTSDFQAVMQKAAGKDLAWFFNQWIFRPGHPTIRAHWAYDESRHQVTIVLQQPSMTVYRFPLDITIVGPGRRQLNAQTVSVAGPETRITVDVRERPTGIVLDPEIKLLAEMDGSF